MKRQDFTINSITNIKSQYETNISRAINFLNFAINLFRSSTDP